MHLVNALVLYARGEVNVARRPYVLFQLKMATVTSQAYYFLPTVVANYLCFSETKYLRLSKVVSGVLLDSNATTRLRRTSLRFQHTIDCRLPYSTPSAHILPCFGQRKLC